MDKTGDVFKDSVTSPFLPGQRRTRLDVPLTVGTVVDVGLQTLPVEEQVVSLPEKSLLPQTVSSVLDLPSSLYCSFPKDTRSVTEVSVLLHGHTSVAVPLYTRSYLLLSGKGECGGRLSIHNELFYIT